MKGSASTRPEYWLAAIWCAAHLPSLAPALEDIDSINFALGLHEFDPARHQPHPPGYPIYIALGRLSLAVVSRVPASWSHVAIDALALAFWSAIGGAIAIVAAASFFRALSLNCTGPEALDQVTPGAGACGEPAFWGAALMAAAPLFWMTGLRPMSDMPGLAAILVALAMLTKGMRERRWLPWGAFIAGLSIGIRSQAMWLTLPLVLLTMAWQRRAGVWWLLSRPVAALAAGGVAWAVPLVVASGGLDAYLRALGTQAQLDFAGVDMVWLHPTPRRLALSLYETFVLPWAAVPLAVVIALAALAGVVALLLRGRQALGVLLVTFGPYAIFHLLLQETVTVRYALPLVPPIAWLAARGISAVGRPAATALSVALVAVTVIVAVPGGLAYGREAHPAFRAIADASRRARINPPAAMYAHYALLRPLQENAEPGFPVVAPELHREWLGLVDYWRGGGTTPVWFLADPRRTDLALIDPAAREDVTRYGWTVADRSELSGIRPMTADWYRLSAPGWFAGEGWSLTPETGGEARAGAKGPDQTSIQAWVRRRDAPMHLVVGTRHLGDPGDPAARFELAIDGRVLDTWTSSVDAPNALRFLDLPDGLPGDGRYATLTVSSHPADGSRRPAPTAVRQFDVQDASRAIMGIGEGWHELEYEPATGRLWRWSSDRAVLRIAGPPRDVRVTLTGESPLRYFATPPVVRIMAGERPVGEFRPDADFTQEILVPADALASAQGILTIVQDRAYLPGQAEGTADARRLGLRLFDVRVHTVVP